MGRLSTHVLDTVTGKPAVGMRIDFSVLDAGAWKLLKTVRTNADGRTDEPLMAGEAMRTGEFRLLFHVADHFRAQGVNLPDPPFLDRVPLRLGSPTGMGTITSRCFARPGATRRTGAVEGPRAS